MLLQRRSLKRGPPGATNGSLGSPPSIPPVLVFQLLLENLQPLDKLKLLACLEFDGDSPQVDVQDLTGHSRHALILAAFQHVRSKLREALLYVGELGLWTATAATLACLRCSPAACLLIIWMVRPAPLSIGYSFYLASFTIRFGSDTSTH